MRWGIAGSMLLLVAGCSRPSPTVRPVGEPILSVPAIEPGEPEPSALDQIREIAASSDAVEWDPELIAAGLGELLLPLRNDPTRSLGPEDEALAELLIDAARRSGTIESAPALLSLEERRFYSAAHALDDVLAREASASAGSCSPPSTEELAHARRDIDGFMVLDRRDEQLVARLPNAREAEDLAYFYAAIAEAGLAVGSARETVQPPTSVDDVEARKAYLGALSDAVDMDDVATGQAYAVAYLTSLGYPGPIDDRLEQDRLLGGTHFAATMRDLARMSEIGGEVGVAAVLYRRANPGGGTCGTSNDYRRGKQLRGAIRSEERAGRCRRVVAERLLDWDHDFGDDDEPATQRYGPARLAAAGWDVGRLYRGALLTRNRADRSAVEQAFQALPSESATKAMARLERMGLEHWEFRVRALEGLADTTKADALEPLVDTLAVASDDLRRRTLETLGALTERYWAGPCPPDEIFIGLDGISSQWQRRISPLGTTCTTQLDDAAADTLATRLAPYVSSSDLEVAAAALEATGKLAAPTSRTLLQQWVEESRQLSKSICADPDHEACQDAANLQVAAAAAWATWSEVVDRSPQG